MNILIAEKGFIYVSIPKNACASIKRNIAIAIGKDSEHVHNPNVWDCLTKEEVSKSQLFRFAVVRNPWDRLLSCYSQKVAAFCGVQEFSPRYNLKTDVSFEYFVNWVVHRGPEEHYAPQTDWLLLNDRLIVDQLVRFENLDAGWNVMAERFSLEPLQKLNASQHVPYREAYDDRLSQIVGDYYAKDIEVLGYKF